MPSILSTVNRGWFMLTLKLSKVVGGCTTAIREEGEYADTADAMLKAWRNCVHKEKEEDFYSHWNQVPPAAGRRYPE